MSTSAIAWLLDPAIKKRSIEKEPTLIYFIPLLIIIAFATKGLSLYLAKATMISVGEEIKKLLYLYTGEVNLDNIPYDENGFPLPPINGELVVTDFINPETGELVVNGTTEMYFQKGGGWYRETYGSDVVTNLMGNNPHMDLMMRVVSI